MHSNYPWTISLCTGRALQFLITDANGNVILMAEMYDEDELLALLTLFQRNPEIRVEGADSLGEKLKERRRRNAQEFFDALSVNLREKFLRENDNDVTKAYEAAIREPS